MAGGGRVTGSVILGSFIVAVIGLSVTPTIASLVTQGATNMSFTGAGQPNITYTSAISILDLFPLFWVLLMIAIPVVAVGLYFKGI
jgi:hypothetical protein